MTQETTGTQETAGTQQATDVARVPARRFRTPLVVAAAIAVPLALGAVGLSVAQTGPAVMAAAPVPVAQLAPWSVVAVKGRVAEIFGNKFVLQDDSGRTLIELGRPGEDGRLVAVGDEVTVQGRFERGFVKASALLRADGRIDVLGKDGRGPGGRGGPDGRGPGDRGPRGAAEWARDKVGLAATPDVQAITAALGGIGFTEIRVVDSGRKHVEVIAKDASGREQFLHVGLDGRIKRSRPVG